MESERRQIRLAKSLHTLIESDPPIIRMEVETMEMLEVADVAPIRNANLALSGGKPFCVLLDTSKGYFNVTPEANRLLASKEYAGTRIATALVVKSLATRLAGNFFMRLRPGSPTRLFHYESDALAWLKTFASKKEVRFKQQLPP